MSQKERLLLDFLSTDNKLINFFWEELITQLKYQRTNLERAIVNNLFYKGT